MTAIVFLTNLVPLGDYRIVWRQYRNLHQFDDVMFPCSSHKSIIGVMSTIDIQWSMTVQLNSQHWIITFLILNGQFFLFDVLSKKIIQMNLLVFQFEKNFFNFIVSFQRTSIIATSAFGAVITIGEAKCAFTASFCLDIGQISHNWRISAKSTTGET